MRQIVCIDFALSLVAHAQSQCLSGVLGGWDFGFGAGNDLRCDRLSHDNSHWTIKITSHKVARPSPGANTALDPNIPSRRTREASTHHEGNAHLASSIQRDMAVGAHGHE